MSTTRLYPLTLLLALGCKAGEPPARPEDLRGPRLTRAVGKPALELVLDDGTRMDFRRGTEGTLTFLFFGYTNCPDVCPLHMSNLGWALEQIPAEQRGKVRVVFVTTDPARDTPERLKAWLANFGPSFVGARGSAADVDAAQQSLGMPVATRDPATGDSAGYTISHGAHLWAFTPDDSAHVVYPLGITREDLAADIPKLFRIWPGR